jgi:hypothetical protein
MTHILVYSHMEQSFLQHFFFRRKYFSITIECDTVIGEIGVLKGGSHSGFEVGRAYKCGVPHLAVCKKPPFLILISVSRTSSTYPSPSHKPPLLILISVSQTSTTYPNLRLTNPSCYPNLRLTNLFSLS